MASIASSIDGRLRLRAPEWRGTSSLAECQAALAELPGVVSVACNERAASLLIHYDFTRTPRPEMEGLARARLGLAAETAEAVDSSVQREDAVSVRGFYRWRPARRDLNRYAKIGAVATMAVSLLAIAARQRRLHVWSGVASLVLTGVHMAINRRNLLR